MKLSQVRKKHVFTENGIEPVVATYSDWVCHITAQENPQGEALLQVSINAFNYDAQGNQTSGCLAGKMIHINSVAELKDLVMYYLDRVEMSCGALLELADYFGEVMTLEELLDEAFLV